MKKRGGLLLVMRGSHWSAVHLCGNKKGWLRVVLTRREVFEKVVLKDRRPLVSNSFTWK